ncbi:rhomboid family intramembrane serine protease [Hyphomicrobium sp. DMF-1]|jgi:membrane associated rhomboid family serine protease|uniref:rhomboid family intramembrane serine protease n=1 Tax=Hyphomicrobium sp. DMF-1 TaxID=3019544 RepID=UPI0022EBC707|nr:rhomboid family intramembrane serine protease [Hyphomicrobium sp. DMF-1]WBT38726.1 rhomboid family intramembrane serine protease [Hyphomicrobium sp. DMF-1]
MFVPLHDENSLKSIRFQYVTIMLIAINVIVYLLERTRLEEVAIASFAIVPRELFDTSLLPIPTESMGPAVPEQLTLLTYMFFHGDVLHLAGNMLFLWVFGDNVEDAMGHLKFLFFYLACGVAGGLLHAWVEPGSESPLIGASGAVAGVIAAYLVLHPRVRVWVLALKAIPLRISAAFALGLWILIQVVMVLLPQVGPVAWWAHIGGLIAGAVLVVFLRRPGVPLFDRGYGYGS